MSLEIYKNLIIGSGEGGKYLAWHLAQSGQHTVVVERRWVGGPARTSIASQQERNLKR
jgi:pyruvate/2-oxoglutarate dehydrogenase complex dihydrolipoamide dehydrogenase (E3) component